MTEPRVQTHIHQVNSACPKCSQRKPIQTALVSVCQLWKLDSLFHILLGDAIAEWTSALARVHSGIASPNPCEKARRRSITYTDDSKQNRRAVPSKTWFPMPTISADKSGDVFRNPGRPRTCESETVDKHLAMTRTLLWNWEPRPQVKHLETPAPKGRLADDQTTKIWACDTRKVIFKSIWGAKYEFYLCKDKRLEPKLDFSRT